MTAFAGAAKLFGSPPTVGANAVTASVTSDEAVASEPNFGDPNDGTDEPNPN